MIYSFLIAPLQSNDGIYRPRRLHSAWIATEGYRLMTRAKVRSSSPIYAWTDLTPFRRPRAASKMYPNPTSSIIQTVTLAFLSSDHFVLPESDPFIASAPLGGAMQGKDVHHMA